MLGLLGLRVFEATGANIEDVGEEHGHRVLRICGKGSKVVLVPVPPAADADVVGQVGQLVENHLGMKGGDRAHQCLGIEHIADDQLSIKLSQPVSRSAFPGERVIPATTCPAPTSSGIKRTPMTPLAPAMKIRMG